MSEIYLIYKDKKINYAASNVRMVVNLIKDKFDFQKDNVNDFRIEKYCLNNIYNHSKSCEYKINSNFELIKTGD